MAHTEPIAALEFLTPDSEEEKMSRCLQVALQSVPSLRSIAILAIDRNGIATAEMIGETDDIKAVAEVLLSQLNEMTSTDAQVQH